jgi:hypothetical protein
MRGISSGIPLFLLNHFLYKNINSMKKFKTYNQIMNEYSDTVSITTPPFSKVVGVDIIDNSFSIVVEIDTRHEYEENKKSFMFIIKKESEFEFMPPIGYEYLKTIIIDNPMISSISNGYASPTTNISLNIINEKKVYRIFICDIKSLAENRDSKLNNLLEGSI